LGYLIGASLALAVSGTATLVGFDRDRAFYPTVLIVASYYAFHHQLIANPGVPIWWPEFCGTYDLVAVAYLAVILRRRAAAA
jgi:hypothetical protein